VVNRCLIELFVNWITHLIEVSTMASLMELRDEYDVFLRQEVSNLVRTIATKNTL
jgi:hypothetical protein